MPEITITDVKTFLESNSDKDEVKNFIKTLQPKITFDKLKELVQTDPDLKKDYFAEIDSSRSKGIESWKTNNLQKLIDEEVAKRNPKETEEQKQLRELKDKFENLEKEKTKTSLINKALKIAQEKQLPIEIVERFIGNDEEETLQNIERFSKVFNDAVVSATKGKFKEFGRKPKENSNDSTTGLTLKQIENMSSDELKRREDEINQFLSSNVAQETA